MPFFLKSYNTNAFSVQKEIVSHLNHQTFHSTTHFYRNSVQCDKKLRNKLILDVFKVKDVNFCIASSYRQGHLPTFQHFLL